MNLSLATWTDSVGQMMIFEQIIEKIRDKGFLLVF